MKGQWVMRAGVAHFVEQRVEPERTEPPYDWRQLIACATCRATVLQSCRQMDGAKRGRRRQPHVLRFAPRLCPCGSALKPHRQLCEPCADESIRRSKREHMRRKRASESEAA